MGKSTINGHFQLQTVSSPEGKGNQSKPIFFKPPQWELPRLPVIQEAQFSQGQSGMVSILPSDDKKRRKSVVIMVTLHICACVCVYLYIYVYIYICILYSILYIMIYYVIYYIYWIFILRYHLFQLCCGSPPHPSSGRASSHHLSRACPLRGKMSRCPSQKKHIA